MNFIKKIAIIMLIMGITNNCMAMQREYRHQQPTVVKFKKMPDFIANNNVKKINITKPSYQRTAFYGAATVTCIFFGSLIYKHGCSSVITQPATIITPTILVGGVSAAVGVGAPYVYNKYKYPTE